MPQSKQIKEDISGQLLNELEEARLLAMEDAKGASAAVSAILAKAKLYGLTVEKHEVTEKAETTVNVELNLISDDELYKIATTGRSAPSQTQSRTKKPD